MLIFCPETMNIVHYCLIGIALVLLVDPIKHLTNKTVDSLKKWKKMTLLSKRIDEVTLEFSGLIFESCKFKGVAEEIAPPDVPRIGPGIRYFHGDTIFFIIPDDNPDLLSVTCGKKKVMIWRKDITNKTVWYYYDETRRITKITGLALLAAQKLFDFAYRYHAKAKSGLIEPKSDNKKLVEKLRVKSRRFRLLDVSVL